MAMLVPTFGMDSVRVMIFSGLGDRPRFRSTEAAC